MLRSTVTARVCVEFVRTARHRSEVVPLPDHTAPLLHLGRDTTVRPPKHSSPPPIASIGLAGERCKGSPSKARRAIVDYAIRRTMLQLGLMRSD
jgi:hypothetical protein